MLAHGTQDFRAQPEGFEAQGLFSRLDAAPGVDAQLSLAAEYGP